MKIKKLNKIIIFKILICSTLLISNCQDSFNVEENLLEALKDEVEIVSKTSKDKSRKKIKYKGLTVNHKYLSSEDELKEEHTEKYLKKLFAKLKKLHNKSSSRTILDEEDLPPPQVLFEASKVVINQFPYEKIEGYNLLAFEENNYIDVEMIKSDFDNFTEADIELNNETIDEYYSQNLDYLVLDEIARNPELYENFSKTSSSDFWIATCTIARSLTNGYGLIRSTIAYSIAGPKANSVSESKYSLFLISSSDTREDAFRHILWSSLLAQNYFTISSKSKRIGFANLVTTKRETTCSDGVGNPIDSREMDFHNNYIGREIWRKIQHTGLF